jgi:hypothetical protein
VREVFECGGRNFRGRLRGGCKAGVVNKSFADTFVLYQTGYGDENYSNKVGGNSVQEDAVYYLPDVRGGSGSMTQSKSLLFLSVLV